jgi:hypothetical protein
MKRVVAIAALLAALAVLTKLMLKSSDTGDHVPRALPNQREFAAPASAADSPADTATQLLAQYAAASPQVRGLVARVAQRFGRNAQAIERTDGLRGLELLDRLDMEALFIYEKHPTEFRRLRNLLGSDAAADLLLHWREYFGLKRADDADRHTLIAEIANLTPAQQRIAARYPNVLPLLLADPLAITSLIQRMNGDDAAKGDVLSLLSFISLERGPSDLRAALRTLDQHQSIALEAFRHQGLEGFAVVSLYGPVLERLQGALPLDQSLILLRINTEYVDELLRTHRPETVAGHLRHVAAAGLTAAVGGSPQALRLMVEFGEPGEQALKNAGPDAADVVFADFADPALRLQAVRALATHGEAALAMLDKYTSDPDFCQILRIHGAAIIPPIAQSDIGPETLAHLQNKTHRSFSESLAVAVLFASGDNGQATIRTIKNDGLERVAQLNKTEVRFYQFLPLYDVMHLGNVLRKGHAPTSSEMTWALVDGCFVITDVLSLTAIQPEGVVAAESLHGEVKAAVRAGVKAAGNELVSSSAESTAKSLTRHQVASGLEHTASGVTSITSRRLARWWTVRSAGGLYEVLRRFPQALPQMSLAQLSDLARPFCARAGLRLSTWRPVRLLRNGAEVVLRIPPERGLKYLSAQAVQAGVGVVGFQKMEEYLTSKRQQNHQP